VNCASDNLARVFQQAPTMPLCSGAIRRTTWRPAGRQAGRDESGVQWVGAPQQVQSQTDAKQFIGCFPYSGLDSVILHSPPCSNLTPASETGCDCSSCSLTVKTCPYCRSSHRHCFLKGTGYRSLQVIACCISATQAPARTCPSLLELGGSGRAAGAVCLNTSRG
jgi:hypothetical protein